MVSGSKSKRLKSATLIFGRIKFLRELLSCVHPVSYPKWFIPDPDPATDFKSSGSSYEFFECQIRIQPILLKHIWKLFKKKTIIEKKIYQLPAIFYCIGTTVLQYTQSRFTGLKLEKKIIYLLFHFFSFSLVILRAGRWGQRRLYIHVAWWLTNSVCLTF